MPVIEYVLRLRCGVCRTAIEFFSGIRVPELPCKLEGMSTVVVPPPGWSVDSKDQLRCPAHEEKRVQAVSNIADALKAVPPRGNGGLH